MRKTLAYYIYPAYDGPSMNPATIYVLNWDSFDDVSHLNRTFSTPDRALDEFLKMMGTDTTNKFFINDRQIKRV